MTCDAQVPAAAHPRPLAAPASPHRHALQVCQNVADKIAAVTPRITAKIEEMQDTSEDVAGEWHIVGANKHPPGLIKTMELVSKEWCKPQLEFTDEQVAMFEEKEKKHVHEVLKKCLKAGDCSDEQKAMWTKMELADA